MTGPQEELARTVGKHAAAALHAMIVRDWATLAESMTWLVQVEHDGYPSTAAAVVGWVDALHDHLFAGVPIPPLTILGASMLRGDGAEFVLGSARADTELPAEYRWSADIINARLSHDNARFSRVWNNAPDDDAFIQHLLALLRTIARTITVERRGFGLERVRFTTDRGPAR